jgi:hypothetical protein
MKVEVAGLLYSPSLSCLFLLGLTRCVPYQAQDANEREASVEDCERVLVDTREVGKIMEEPVYVGGHLEERL